MPLGHRDSGIGERSGGSIHEPLTVTETMANTSSSSSGGIGFVGLLTVLFVGLKLAKVIAWSWVWVLAPIWISFALGISLVAVYLIYTVRADRKHRKEARTSAFGR